MNRFIYYYRVFDILVNQPKGSLISHPYIVLCMYEWAVAGRGNKDIKGNETSCYRASNGACRLPDKFLPQRYGRSVQWLTTRDSIL